MELKKIITDAVKYWEPRRLIYNGVLALIVGYYAAPVLWERSQFDYLGGVLGLFVLAVIANILYCSAYLVDVFLQLSDFRDLWRKFRWTLLTIGILVAAIFTWVIAQGVFAPYAMGK